MPEKKKPCCEEPIPVGPFVLITIGLILLGQTTGFMSWAWWPLILIVIGIIVLANHYLTKRKK